MANVYGIIDILSRPARMYGVVEEVEEEERGKEERGETCAL